MRQIALAVALAFALPLGSAAEDALSTDKAEGLSLMERGAQIFLRGLMKDLDPVVEDFEAMAQEFGPKMQELMAQMGPKLAELADRIDDVANYSAPEILPNGDIIIRRRPDAPPYRPDVSDDAQEIEL